MDKFCLGFIPEAPGASEAPLNVTSGSGITGSYAGGAGLQCLLGPCFLPTFFKRILDDNQGQI